MVINKVKIFSKKELNKICAALTSGLQYKLHNLPADVPDTSICAFYLNKKLIHVGHSRSTRKYLHDIRFHPNSFLPFNLARVATGHHLPTYDGGPASVAALLSDPFFVAVLEEKRASLAKVTVCIVTVENDAKLEFIHKAVQLALNCPPVSARTW